MTTKHKILVIDDDPIMLEVLTGYFEIFDGAECITANNGAMAKTLVEKHGDAIKLITCDINMPDSDGIEFLLSLKQCDYQSPIVLITGAPGYITKSAKTLANSYGLNFLGLLEKPLDFKKLDEVLDGANINLG